jgi:hypothetical protein
MQKGQQSIDFDTYASEHFDFLRRCVLTARHRKGDGDGRREDASCLNGVRVQAFRAGAPTERARTRLNRALTIGAHPL